MKRIFCIFLVSGFSSAIGQTEATLGALITSSVSLDKASGLTMALKNVSRQPVTAWLVRTRAYEAGKLRMDLYSYMDVYVNAEHDRPLAAGEIATVRVVPTAATSKYQFKSELVGALFANGSASGNTDAIEILDGRRRVLGDAIRETIRIINDANSKQSGREHLIRDLTEKIRSALPSDNLTQKERYIVSVKGQLAEFLKQSIGTADDVCDDVCNSNRISGALQVLTRWHGYALHGVTERGTAEMRATR